MMSGLFLSYCLTVFTTGISCGVGCNAQINFFLSTCIINSSKNVRNAFETFYMFYMGKLASVVTLCMVTSCVGKTLIWSWLDSNKLVIRVLLYLSFIVVGISCIATFVQGLQNRKNGHCCKNSHCGERGEVSKRTPFLVGMFYGISPCAPFLMLLGYCATVNLWKAFVLGVLFIMANAFSPVLLLVALTGIFTKKIHIEAPKVVQWIRLLLGIFLIIIGGYGIATVMPI